MHHHSGFGGWCCSPLPQSQRSLCLNRKNRIANLVLKNESYDRKAGVLIAAKLPHSYLNKRASLSLCNTQVSRCFSELAEKL